MTPIKIVKQNGNEESDKKKFVAKPMQKDSNEKRVVAKQIQKQPDNKSITAKPMQKRPDNKSVVANPRKKSYIDKLTLRLGQNARIIIGILIGIVLAVIFFFLKKSILVSLIVLVAFVVLFLLYFYFKKKLEESARKKKIEELFPDFLQLMASNLRAGITVDRAMLLSARKEFEPLSGEILKTGRDITAGKEIENALMDLSKRLNNPKIHKTILLLISGIKAGGNIAVLLEETSVNMQERSFVEKKAASNVLMYVIFIFIAVAVGAPALFSLSGILVSTMSKLLLGVPETPPVYNVPFTLSKVNVSPVFIEYFSLAFIIATGVLASLILGLVSKGEEREGLKYLPPILIISLAVFFIIKLALAGFVNGLF